MYRLFIVYFAERKWGFGKSIFIAIACYAAGLFTLYASNKSPELYIFTYAIVVGFLAAGNSFPVILASISRGFFRDSQSSQPLLLDWFLIQAVWDKSSFYPLQEPW